MSHRHGPLRGRDSDLETQSPETVMTIEVKFTDKILTGVYHSFTVTSDEGPPSGDVVVDGNSLPHRVIHLQDPKYKISFRVPDNSAGKELVLKLTAGMSIFQEAKEIVAE